MKACVFTLGCKMNEVESASLVRGLQERGFETTTRPEYADLYILNTCAVTAEAARKSRQAVARLKKFNPDARFIVCGCASESTPEDFERDGVTLICGTGRKGDILNKLEEEGVFLEKETGFCDMPMPAKVGTRAFLRIQDGCNRFCSYCLIPYLRGRSRSRGAESIVREAYLSAAKEIVLTGIDISSYRDGDTDLGALILMLKDVPARFRIGSLEAGIIDRDFLLKMKEAGNFVPHFHLSLQSGSSAVLKAMNRKYTREEYLQTCRDIYEIFPDAAITTDIIVGFPTETEEDFLQTLSIVREVGFARVHAFPFSPRKGTRAEKLPDLPAAVKKERVSRLMQTAAAVQREYEQKFFGKTLNVLFEDDGGYSENYIRVYAEGAQEGELQRVLVTDFYRDGVIGEIAE